MAVIDPSQLVMLGKRSSGLRSWRELLIATRFALVGIAATATHMLAVMVLLRNTSIVPVAANAIAFLIAFVISFSGNYLWTFQPLGDLIRAMRRFFLIASGAFVVNTILLILLVSGGWFSPFTSAILSASVVPAISFVASRFWGFR